MLKDLPRDILFSASPYPARRVAPIATALAEDLTKYSWWGRTHLHIREGEERRIQLESLILGIKLELDAIDTRKAKLEEEKREVERTTKLYETMKEDLRKKRVEEDALKKEIQSMDNAVIRGGRQYQGKLNKGGFERAPSLPAVLSGGGEERRDAVTPHPQIAERPELDFSSDDDIDGDIVEEKEGGDEQDICG